MMLELKSNVDTVDAGAMSTAKCVAESTAELADPTVHRRESKALPCVHCGEPTLCDSAQDPAAVFCCQGCLGAHRLIRGLGLDSFYDLRAQSGHDGVDRPLEARDYAAFDRAEFLGESQPETIGGGQASSKLAVQGLHCAACSWLIENALAAKAGVVSSRVRMGDHSLQVVFEPSQVALSQIAELLGTLGYQLTPWKSDSRDERVRSESRTLLMQIAVAGFLAANAMWIAVALYAGASSTAGYFMGLVGTGLGVVSVLGPGRTFFQGAMAALRTRTPHMDLPVALGLSVATVAGVANAVLGTGYVYFDSVTTLVFLLLIGRWLKFRQQARAAKAVDLMLRLLPRFARRKKVPKVDAPDEFEEVAADALVAGDVVEVRTGECLPADGVILAAGIAEAEGPLLDCSLLSGESRPVRVASGETIFAGAVNVGPTLRFTVTTSGEETRIGEVMSQVEETTAQRVPVVMLADRIGGVFVVVVTLLALFTFAIWISSGYSTAASYATALLIVACPCALALATPLAIATAIGRSAKRGLLIRDGGIFQRLSKPGVVWLDKTGTLTTGRQQVTTLIGSEEALRLAAALERDCKHPVASAIVEKARELEEGPNEIQCEHVAAVSNGRKGRVGGHWVVIGNQSCLENEAVELTAKKCMQLEGIVASGESPCLIAVDGVLAAMVGVSDPIRAEAASVVKRLEGMGWQVGILSGDHAEIVRRVATRLGVAEDRCYGSQTPEQKLAFIEESSPLQPTVMVGDGANDAAALAAADVGIAVRGGAEASLHAAPVLLGGGIGKLDKLMLAAQRTQGTILLTFTISLAYNVAAVGLAMLGMITPLIAAVFMPISSLSVLSLVLGRKTFSDD